CVHHLPERAVGPLLTQNPRRRLISRFFRSAPVVHAADAARPTGPPRALGKGPAGAAPAVNELRGFNGAAAIAVATHCCPPVNPSVVGTLQGRRAPRRWIRARIVFPPEGRGRPAAPGIGRAAPAAGGR